MKFGPTILVLLLSCVSLTANITSVKAKPRVLPKLSAATDTTKSKAPAKSTPTPSRPTVFNRSVPKALPVTALPAPKALPVAQPVPNVILVFARNTRTPARIASKSWGTKKTVSRSTSTAKAKPIPVIIPDRCEYIDISFPEPRGGKASSKKKPAESAREREPVEDIPGLSPPARVDETPEAIAAVGRW